MRKRERIQSMVHLPAVCPVLLRFLRCASVAALKSLFFDALLTDRRYILSIEWACNNSLLLIRNRLDPLQRDALL
jgi:hypothetical protein